MFSGDLEGIRCCYWYLLFLLKAKLELGKDEPNTEEDKKDNWNAVTFCLRYVLERKREREVDSFCYYIECKGTQTIIVIIITFVDNLDLDWWRK